MDEAQHRRTIGHYYVCSFCGVTSVDSDDIIFAQITEAQAYSWNPNVRQRSRYDVCNLHFHGVEFSRRGRTNRLSDGAIPIELRPPSENEADDVVMDDFMMNDVGMNDEEMIEEYLDDDIFEGEMMGGEILIDNGGVHVDEEASNDDESEHRSSDDVTDGTTSEYEPDPKESNTSSESRYESEEQEGVGVEANNEDEEVEFRYVNDLTEREIEIMTKNPKFYLGIIPEYLGLLSKQFYTYYFT